MDCIYCNTSLPDKGFFCPNCFKQVKCKHCSEYLLKDAKICIYCGEEIGQKTSDTSMNTIEFSENETERNFKASFTDTVGQSISDTFGMLLANKIGSRKPLSPALLNSNDTSQQQSTIDVDAEIVNDSRSDDTVTNEISVIPTLEEIKLRDLAKTETDWLLVYTYYASQGGNKQFTRDEIIQYYQDTERYTKKRKSGLSQYIKNITKSRYIKPTNETDFILLDKGKNKAIEIFNGNSISNSIKKKLPSEKNEEKAKPKKTSNSVEFIDLKLTLTEQKSLKALFGAKNPQSQNESVLVVMKWYIDAKKVTEVSKEEINYLLSITSKAPSALPQVLGNMIGSNYRWLTKGTKGKYELSSLGESHVDRLPKKATK